MKKKPEQNDQILVHQTTNAVLVDFDFEFEKFDEKPLSQPLLINIIDRVKDLISKIETNTKPHIAILKKDNKFRKISLYTTLFLLLIIFIFAIVGGATEMYYFFYIAMGLFFIKTTLFTLANFIYFNSKFNGALAEMKSRCKNLIEQFNESSEAENNHVACGLNYGRVVNEMKKNKVTFYRKIKIYLLFYQISSNLEEDIDDFENANFQIMI